MNTTDPLPRVRSTLAQHALRCRWRTLALGAVAFNVLTANPHGATFKVLVGFQGPGGGAPNSLLEGADGRLYGTTEAGGSQGYGVVFSVRTDGKDYRVLHEFAGAAAEGDGAAPVGLSAAADGTLYGTTRYGGAQGGVATLTGLEKVGNGTVFRLRPDGTDYQVLRRFQSSDGDGAEPWAGLAVTASGTLYGTTLLQGRKVAGQWIEGIGTVYTLRADGNGYQVLHEFGGDGREGARPFSTVAVAPDGTLIGATDAGGVSRSGNGVLYRMNPDGSGFRVIHSFPSGPEDGRMPRTRLVPTPDGGFVGTTQHGGKGDFGTIFWIPATGRGYRILHHFTGGVPNGDGSEPQELVVGPDGALYGAARMLGPRGGGTVYRLKPGAEAGSCEILYAFPIQGASGHDPIQVVLGRDGALYGVASQGDGRNAGTLFRIALHPEKQ